MAKRVHMAMATDADRHSDSYIRKRICSCVTVNGAHPTVAEFRRMCVEARAEGLEVFPPCDNTDERGYCQGHEEVE